jgi:hypothetical protein
MYCMDNCLELKLCRKTKAADAVSAQDAALADAVKQLHQAVASTNASIDNCFVFTLENRNSLMHHIADVKEQANRFGCGYLLELCALTEIITMILFRSHHYRDRQGLEQIELAVQQMHVCCAAQANSQSQNDRKSSNLIAETVECLWRWVDMNTLPGIPHLN